MTLDKAKEINSEWKKCKKKIYNVTLYVPKIGTHVYNKFENSSYVTNESKPYVLIGTAGEEWTIDANKLAKTYTFNKKELTSDVLKKLSDGKKYKLTTKGDDSPIQWCRLAKGKETIKTSWGETLEANRDGVSHGKGDYIIATNKGNEPNENDQWVVNGEIFPKTYSLLT